MAKDKMPKPSKWFSNKGLRLSFNRRRSSKSSSSSTLSYSSSSPPVSPRKQNNTASKLEDELKQVFRYFDTNGDEKISALELRSFFGSIGEYMSHEEAESVIIDLDSDGDKLLDFDDFLKVMKGQGNNKNDKNNNIKDEEEDIKKAFEMFEMEKGSGCITPKGLQRMLNRLGDSRSYDECVAMINVFDIDGNGVLDFHEFYQMMS